jgi:energy-coupling factor transporter transmembrane protein EcfT
MLRVLAVLAALTVVGGILRFEAASDPSRYQSKDEQSYAMIARGLSVTGKYGNPGMSDPVHWPPGAPLLFALAYELKPEKRGGGVWDVPSAYNLQALVGTLTIPAAFGLAFLIAGWGAGLVAAAGVTLYPPLISASGDLLSEPLGAFLLTSALAATVWSLRRPGWWPPSVLAGLLLGATVLTRADLALVPAIALLVVAVAAWRRTPVRAFGAVARAAGPMLVALVVILTPWTVFASNQAGHLVALSSGGGSNLWVGTYLPGNGSMFGAKRALADEVRARNPELAGKKYFQLRQTDVIAAVAARHPGLSTDAALRKEGMQNLEDYALGDPVSFAGMAVRKVWRLWGGYPLGTYRNPRTWITVLHLALVAFGAAGLVAGLAFARTPGIWLLAGVLLYVTAINAVLVSEARHNLSVMPIVVAAGAAGVFLAASRLRARGSSPGDEVTATRLSAGASRGAPASPTAPR